MFSASRAIEDIETGMLELLLMALGAYEGQLSDTARKELIRRRSRDRHDDSEEMRRAARALRQRAVSLGSPAQRYATVEWRSLGL